jgi:hypothetical protein
MMGRKMFRRPLYLCTIFISSLLLFLIQPMMGKSLLPLYGGSAGVWTTVMLFFQAGLLLGYAYSHWSSRLRPAAHTALHLLLLVAGGFAVAIGPQPAVPGGAPVIQILTTLSVSIGLPYVLLCSTGPLVQAWWARFEKTHSPYRLFALSNVASLGALLLYPVLIEPRISTGRQLRMWSAVYGLWTLIAAGAALVSRGAGIAIETAAEHESWRDRLLWIGLAACPSALWLGMAHAISQNVAPVPLLWILPLGVYLLSFILCFDREGWYRPGVYRVALPVSWVVMGYGLVRQDPVIGLKGTVALLLAALFACCMFCHGELALRKPHAGRLTSFYLLVALGGACGGLFVAVIAPVVFDQLLEFPIAVAACVVLAMGLLYRLPTRRVARLAIVGAAAFVVAAQVNDFQTRTVVRRRNFYGALQVSESGQGDATLRVLSSGAIRHGAQFVAEGRSRIPTTYYGEASGAAAAIRSLGERRLRAGVIGLGAGTLAAYARPGDQYVFYELNPAVIETARTQFRYLRDARGAVEVKEGDGRLGIQREHDAPFDMVVLDAFSGDSIPTHLLTREAFAVYFSHLTPDGVLAVHMTNRYVDLESVVRDLAADAGRQASVIRSPADAVLGTYEAVWALITSGSSAKKPRRIWTDDFSDLFDVLR